MQERIDDLNLDGLKIIQQVGGYAFTSDSVLLANFVKAKKTDMCLEIGTGSGIISILVNYKEKPQKIVCYEMQKSVADLAKRNIKLNSMDNVIEVIDDKIQNWSEYNLAGSFDVIFSNPPYFKYDNNVKSENEERTISRFDKFLPIEELFTCVQKLLKFGGKFYFVYDSSRLDEVICGLKNHSLTPKRIYFVHPSENKNSSVFLCEAVKGGRQFLKVLQPLFTNNLDGEYIQTIQKLYKGKN